jgi:hypothetical protein
MDLKQLYDDIVKAIDELDLDIECKACIREKLMKENPSSVFMMNAISHTCKKNYCGKRNDRS